MDFNGDGKVDIEDYIFYKEFFEKKNGNGGGSGDDGDSGCLTWVIIGLVVLHVINCIVKIIY